MGGHRYSQKILPKFQDLDTDVKYVRQGGVRYMKNVRLGSPTSSNLEIIENIKGTLKIPFSILPNGKNKCIGSGVDIKKNRIIFANYNSENNHCIYAYLIDKDKIVEVYKDTPDNIILDFVEDYKIQGTRIVVLDGKYLFWTDRYNAQRFLDIDKAIEDDKQKIWHIRDTDELIRATIGGTYHEFYLNDVTDVINNLFEVEKCDCKYIFTEKNANSLIVECEHFIPQNFYPKPHNERQIDFILYPPHTAPKTKLAIDGKYIRNFLGDNTWQFRVRYKYRNNAYSVWSAWSKLISSSFDCANSAYNAIDVDYSADIFKEFNDYTEFNLIDSVEIGYRNTNNGELNKFINIPQCEIPKDKQVYRFFNDIHSEIRPEIEDILQYDAIPLKSGALNLAGDTILLADNIEDYPNECFDFDVNVKFTPNGAEKKGGLKTKIRIYNPLQVGRYSENQPIIKRDSGNVMFGGLDADTGTGRPKGEDIKKQDEFEQRLPEGGFIGYLVGTDYLGISKQIRLDGVTLFDGDKNLIKLETDGDWHQLDGAIDGKELYSILEIKDIPVGRYIFRLASHLCSYGDILGRGEYYNLENSSLYQQTSTNVYGIIENGELRLGIKEIVVDITENGTTIIPDFVIEDLIYIPRERGDNAGHSINGYVKDRGGESGTNSTLENYIQGIAVEGAIVNISGVGNAYKPDLTDHNGYFYTRSTGSGILGIYLPRFSVRYPFLTDADMINNNQFVYQSNNFSLSDFYNNNATQTLNSQLNYGESTGGYTVGIPNYNPAISQNNRTKIIGKVVDVNGNAVAGLDYVVTNTNRKGKTDAFGKYEVVVYNRNHPLGRLRGEIIFYSKDGCLSFEFKKRDFDISRIASNGYNMNNFFEMQDIVYPIDTNTLGQRFYLKNGGVYDFGIEELDRGNRKSTLYFSEKKHRIRLPFTTEKIRQYLPQITQDTNGNTITEDTQADGYFTAEIILKSKPSLWSTHLYILRTEDQVYSDYLQFGVSDVKYVKSYAETEDGIIEPNETNYNGSDANEIYLDINTSFTEYKKRNSESNKGWTFESGDRIRFIYREDGSVFSEFYESEVKAQRGNWFIIDNIEGLPELKQGVIVEIFRLKQKRQQQLFYEIGEHTKVEDRYLPTRHFRETEIELNTGDAYRRTRNMYLKSFNPTTNVTILTKTVNITIEDTTVSDRYIGKDNDIGRPSIVNNSNFQKHRPSSIRFGGKYIIGSNINEIHSFIPTDIVEVNTQYGRITIIEDFENVLFVAQEKKCHVRYINKSRATLGDGQTIVLDNNRFLSSPDYFAHSYGCTNPESFTRADNAIFFIDINAGAVIQYSVQNGLGNISGIDLRYNKSRGQDAYVKKITKEIAKIPIEVRNNVAFIYGGYHTQEYNELFITFEAFNKQSDTNYSFLNKVPRNSNIGAFDDKFLDYSLIKQYSDISVIENTITYDNGKNFWYGDRGHHAECYTVLGGNAFAIKDGEVHILDKTDAYNNFFGKQDTSRLVVIMNDNPSEIKDFIAFSVESNKFWKNIKNTVPFNSYLGRKQESVTLPLLIQNKNGIWYGAIQKDELTPNKIDPLYNGNDMVGDVMLLEFECDSNEKVELYAINVYAGYIGRTNF